MLIHYPAYTVRQTGLCPFSQDMYITAEVHHATHLQFPSPGTLRKYTDMLQNLIRYKSDAIVSAGKLVKIWTEVVIVWTKVSPCQYLFLLNSFICLFPPPQFYGAFL